MGNSIFRVDLFSSISLPGVEKFRSRGGTGVSKSGCREDRLEKGLQGSQFYTSPANDESPCQG